ncbi:MAG: hypothetical protein NTW87_36365 [Planctomycetota bacterium]|nr:hypothetical protein [Planctomycetota bacterium]
MEQEPASEDEAQDGTADADGEAEDSSAASPERALVWWFVGVLAVNVAGVVWVAVRTESPSFVRSILDFFLYSASGAFVAYFAFRALFLYSFRLSDLLVIVLVLSLGMKATIDVLSSFSALGVINVNLVEPGRVGQVFQVCLLTGSILLAGAALGLRHCTILKLEGAFARVLIIVAGMLALPAAAGSAAFPVPAVRQVMNEPQQALVWLLLWFVSLGLTGVNVVYFIRTLTLRTEIKSQEKLP